MAELRIDRTYHPLLQELLASGEMSEDGLRRHIYGQLSVELAIDQLLEDGEGELAEEDCDRIGTELPPGLYRHIRITDDGDAPQVLCTIYMRTVEGELDELWLAQSWEAMSPNPVDVVPETLSYIPGLIGGPPRELQADREQKQSMPILPDARGSQGVSGRRPTLRVKFIESPDYDHRWQFPNLKVRSTTLAPVLLLLREAGCKKVPLSLLRQAIDHHQGALRGA